MQPGRSGEHPEDIRGRQGEVNWDGNDVREDRTERKARASDMVDREASMVRGHMVDVVNQMEPTVRDHSAEMVGRKATMVRVDGVDLLEVDDEAGQAHEVAKRSVGRLGRKSRVLSPISGTYRWMCG